jgi:hypothetical protein
MRRQALNANVQRLLDNYPEFTGHNAGEFALVLIRG